MRPILATGILLCAASLAGCATITKGSNQYVEISPPPTSGATCTLTNPEGHWTVMSTGAVQVRRSKADMQVRCSKAGWQDATGLIPSNFQSWTAGNLVLGGVIGLGVDAATGAINDYPHTFQVPMLQTAPAAPADTSTAPVSGKPAS